MKSNRIYNTVKCAQSNRMWLLSEANVHVHLHAGPSLHRRDHRSDSLNNISLFLCLLSSVSVNLHRHKLPLSFHYTALLFSLVSDLQVRKIKTQEHMMFWWSCCYKVDSINQQFADCCCQLEAHWIVIWLVLMIAMQFSKCECVLLSRSRVWRWTSQHHLPSALMERRVWSMQRSTAPLVLWRSVASLRLTKVSTLFDSVTGLENMSSCALHYVFSVQTSTQFGSSPERTDCI